jgi:predicted nucleotidyltransferase
LPRIQASRKIGDSNPDSKRQISIARAIPFVRVEVTGCPSAVGP